MAELLKQLKGEKEKSKFRRNTTGDGESIDSNEEMAEAKEEEINNFKEEDLPMYNVGATSLILPAIF